ncbi:hypothetical protein [Kibdelosporangium aridum]|uniref:Uncharacterized protein n=1 Tax=Kibdelosporangium aridum TaxID=2030 RepID=A0A1W2G006_KIBAR|nr:hypothetical protein [Kibdelosporangium aridum]SMD27322.1 hypothetical protein SAMN05661093_10925 [Kibdelosporangium aridum]
MTTADGDTVTAGPGEVIYTTNSSTADEDTEMVYVANPPDVYAAHMAASG